MAAPPSTTTSTPSPEAARVVIRWLRVNGFTEAANEMRTKAQHLLRQETGQLVEPDLEDVLREWKAMLGHPLARRVASVVSDYFSEEERRRKAQCLNQGREQAGAGTTPQAERGPKHEEQQKEFAPSVECQHDTAEALERRIRGQPARPLPEQWEHEELSDASG